MDTSAERNFQEGNPAGAAEAVEALYRSDWGRIVATLIGVFHDFDLAEESAQEAFTAALDQWASQGVPELPRAWIIQTARHKAIDRLRRRQRFEQKLESYASGLTQTFQEPDFEIGEEMPDDRLRLIFTCCHPALSLEAQIALTLRTLCGLETDEIARAFLVNPATMAQRLVRAKRKIQGAGIPYSVPAASEIPERLEAVLSVIYLVFNEGYASTRGGSLVRTDLCAEAIRLGRLVRTLFASKPPAAATGLLALMLLQDARRNARVNPQGDIVLLDEQDRQLWDRRQIAEALTLVQEALAAGPGPFQVQAAIAAVHCQARRPEETDWAQILRLYGILEELQPSPIVRLNGAVALAMVEGPEQALAAIDAPGATGDLEDYHLLHAVRADLLRRTGAMDAAARSYQRALALVRNESERRFLEQRLLEVEAAK